MAAQQIYGINVIDNCLFLNNIGTYKYIGGNAKGP